MRSEALLIIEIVLSILFLYYLLSINQNLSYNIRGFREEDLVSSLISINYLNISNISYLGNITCGIVSDVLDEYIVFINGTMVCNNTNQELSNSIKLFYIVNGSPVFLTVYMR